MTARVAAVTILLRLVSVRENMRAVLLSSHRLTFGIIPLGSAFLEAFSLSAEPLLGPKCFSFEGPELSRGKKKKKNSLHCGSQIRGEGAESRQEPGRRVRLGLNGGQNVRTVI